MCTPATELTAYKALVPANRLDIPLRKEKLFMKSGSSLLRKMDRFPNKRIFFTMYYIEL